MHGLWDPAGTGVLRLPSGRLLRGRGLRHPLPSGSVPSGPVPSGPSDSRPTFAVYLTGRPPPAVEWEYRWLRWPDFWLPSDRAQAERDLREAWERSKSERVEIACGGGRGRTGTALACIAVIDGVPPGDAVAYVRRHYNRHAVETPWQKRFVARFGSARPG